jgi:predicted ATPase
LLRAIAELEGAAAVASTPSVAAPHVEAAGERRQVTVMFSDLVGSTALSTRMEMEATSEKWGEPELLRMAGEVALKLPQPDAATAEAYFQRALALTRRRGAKSLELRVTMSLARLWRDQGNRDAARDLLAPV